jgi:hypothetical protein
MRPSHLLIPTVVGCIAIAAVTGAIGAPGRARPAAPSRAAPAAALPAAADSASPASPMVLNIVVGATQSPVTVHPGDAGVVLMAIQIDNTYTMLGGPRVLRSLRLTNTTGGPGSVADRDAELGTVRLYLDDGDSTFDAGDALVDQRAAASGAVTFPSLNVSSPANSTIRLYVVTRVPAVARDGDALDLSIQASTDVVFDQAATFGNTFPVAPAGSFPVDGMTAFQIAIGATGSGSLLAGTTNNLVLDLKLPANGYEPDVLQQIAVVNVGTAANGTDITALKLWADNGDGVFNPASDALVGPLVYTGARWQITGRSDAIPKAGLRLFVTADLNDFAVEGHTLQLGLPSFPDLGVGVASANDGPIDHAVGAPIERAVSTANRVTLAAASVPPAVARPGQAQVPLLQIAAANSYSTPQVLDRLTVTNAGVGGTIAERDGAVQTLTLRLDGNDDGVLGDAVTDPPLATAFFSDGEATFSGLGFSLAAGATKRFFVAADVSLTAAADGDTLSARIAGSLDVSFSDTTRVVASWPLDSRARAGVDGMIAAQLGLVAPPATTLAPDDSNVVALDVRIPRNGHADDVLQRLDVVNQGTATPADVAEVRFWRDGGDGVFTGSGGDDVDLGAATWTGGSWRSAPLAQALGAGGARLFAVLRTSSAPTDGASVRLAVPVNGVTVASGNDGPLDASAPSPTTLIISNSPLLASLAIAPGASTSGQAVSVTMTVRNTGSESITGITPSALVPSGAGGLTLSSGPTPATLALAAGGADTIHWTYTAATAGDVRLTGHAQGTGNPSGTPRQSLDAASNLHHVYDPATRLDTDIPTSLPPTVNRGATGVVPLTVRVASAGGAQAAPVRLRALRIGLEDENGVGIVPNQLLARVAVNEGTTNRLSKTTLESSGSEVDLTLASPAIVSAGQTVELTVSLDVLGNTTVSAFRVDVVSAAWLVAEDANTGAAVPIQLTSGAFPVKTGVARVVDKASRLDIAANPSPPRAAGAGQVDVPLASLRLSSTGAAGITNDVRVTALAFDADDTTGTELARLADVIGWIRVRTPFQTLASRAVFTSDGASLTVPLNPALSIPVNTPIDVAVSGDIASAAGPRGFRLRLADSTKVDARDAVSRDPIPVAMTSDPLPGAVVTIQSPADTVQVAGTPRMPASVRAGDANVAALSIRLRHPGLAGAAPLRLDSLVLLSRDESRRPLVPSQYVSRVRVLWNGVEVGRENAPPSSGDAVGVATGRQTLAAGDSALVDVLVDFAATAPQGFLEEWVFGDGLFVFDADLGTRAAVVAAADPLPLLSGLAHIQAPARVLTAGLASTLPAALAGDGREVPAGLLTLANPAATGAGDITVDHLVVHAVDRGLATIALGGLAAGVAAYVNGALWAQSAPLTTDSTTATLAAGAPLAVAPTTSALVELRVVTRTGVGAGSLRLELDAADVGVVQPGSALLQIQVLPATGQSFPLRTEAGGFGARDLAASYSNFPNPFAAGRQDTHFAFYLAAPGRAWLRVTTVAGEAVATLVDGEARGAGLQQSDRWDGRNGAGQTVRNGVYIAELTVRYDDGSRARVLRKVAVVR